MNITAAVNAPAVSIARPEQGMPILAATGRETIILRGRTRIRIDGMTIDQGLDRAIDVGTLIPGEDYGVKFNDDGKPFASLLGPENPIDAGWIGGFHFAPGGNATDRAGGDAVPAINPHSIWDIGFRPSCQDPRGMAFVEASDLRVWVDIYLLGADHKRNGTSRCGVKIADGNSLDRLNYKDAAEIVASHGKRLLSYDEFRVAAAGVTERSSADRHPKTTGLDAARTSRFGIMQATGNLWVWGTDGDPEDPRPSVFGGSWLDGSNAGSRCALLGDWPGDSYEVISARGGSDHLSPA